MTVNSPPANTEVSFRRLRAGMVRHIWTSDVAPGSPLTAGGTVRGTTTARSPGVEEERTEFSLVNTAAPRFHGSGALLEAVKTGSTLMSPSSHHRSAN